MVGCAVVRRIAKVWRARLLKWFHALGLYLLAPAIAVVVWGELSSGPDQIEALYWDKALHFIAYFGLAGMICLALNGSRKVVAATLALILFGGVLEIVQGFVGRDTSFYDELANTLGAITGAGVGWLALFLLQGKALAAGRRN
jgi:VanZ family protein